MCLKRSWSDFDPQAYYLYGEDQNHETSFKGKALQVVVDSWCKIQVLHIYFDLRSYWVSLSTKKSKIEYMLSAPPLKVDHYGIVNENGGLNHVSHGIRP